jgi:formylglycine-generating enzyme
MRSLLAVTLLISDCDLGPERRMCPSEMVLVDGMYCPEVAHPCLKWMDPPGRFQNFRCVEYGPAVCLSKERVEKRFCIDRHEYTKPGEQLPLVNQSWTTANALCRSIGKRLCLESEWELACEGEELRPYPYGWVRDPNKCNIDRTPLKKPEAYGLIDWREPADARPACVSPYGVYNMSGNTEEWATLDQPTHHDDRSTMKGAWWLPGRNTCRAKTTGHGEHYAGAQVGVRCCADTVGTIER